jgi:uncharacterized protein (DUF58 family)
VARSAAALAPRSEDLARAARLLWVRSRREATGLFAGNYASAFRGGGLEFEESRPYAPGDDVRSIDWNATARRGETYVKRFREERDQTLLFAYDCSASMRFGSGERSQAGTAAHALALLATAAGRAGDRIGLVAFDRVARALIPPARGVAHGRRVIETALACAATAAGGTRLDAGLRALRAKARRRSVLVLFSDFRDETFLADPARDAPASELLAELGRRHDLVAAALQDRLELALPAVGPLRLADPERPGETRVLDTGRRRVREAWLAACAARREALARALRRAGADLLWLRTDQSPFHAIGRFFQERAARRQRISR